MSYADKMPSPISDYWKVSLTPQKCLNQASHLLAASIINTITDFMTVFLPIKTVLGLHLPKRQRLIICLLFSGGIVASIAGAVRTYFSWLCASTPDHDTTWIAYYVTLTSSVELFLGIVSLTSPRILQPSGPRFPSDHLTLLDMRLPPRDEAFLQPLRPSSDRTVDGVTGDRAPGRRGRQKLE